MRSILMSLLALLGTTAAAFAAPAQWTVDPPKSQLGFHIAVSGQPVDGSLPFGAVIAFDATDLAHSSIKATIDMTGAKSGNATAPFCYRTMSIAVPVL